jgi:hypothetical protein
LVLSVLTDGEKLDIQIRVVWDVDWYNISVESAASMFRIWQSSIPNKERVDSSKRQVRVFEATERHITKDTILIFTSVITHRSVKTVGVT